MLDGYKSTDTSYIYINAPCFYIESYAAFGAFWTSGIIMIYPSYWAGAGWSEWGYYQTSGTTADTTKYCGHNRSESSHSRIWDMDNDYPIWQIKVVPKRDNGNWHVRTYAGSWDMANKAPSFPTGKLIHSTGNASANIYQSGTTQRFPTDSDWPFRYQTRTGSVIYASNEREVSYYPDLNK